MHVAFQLCGRAKDAFEPPILVLLEFYQPKVKQKKNGEPQLFRDPKQFGFYLSLRKATRQKQRTEWTEGRTSEKQHRPTE